VAAGPVEIHTTIPAGTGRRVLRLADTAAEGWTATLDGTPLTPTTVDGWAQGFELPAAGGRLDVTYDDPFGHTAWLWTQGLLALVLVVLALPGRRRDIDDDLPDEEPAVPAQAVEGEGRRARRLRAQAEAEEAARDAGETPGPAPRESELPPVPQEAPAAVPQQQPYGEWDATTYQTPGYDGYGGYQDGHQGEPYQQEQQYQGDQQQYAGYGQGYQDPYQAGQYDPYGYGDQPQQGSYDQHGTYDQQPYQQQGYDPAAYGPGGQTPTHDPGNERPDGSQQ
jgi:hypothetical protein